MSESMRVLSWVEFTQPDRRVLHFSPDGLLVHGRMYEEASAEFIQRMIAESDLHQAVPRSVADYFEGARQAFNRGYFSYDLFAVSWTMATLAHEFALGERFMESIDRTGTFQERRSGAVESQAFLRFGDLVRATTPGASRAKKAWKLLNGPAHGLGYWALLSWAREHGPLRSWLDERWQRAAGPTYSMLMTNEISYMDAAVWREMPQEARDDWFRAEAQMAWEMDQLRTLRDIRNSLAHPDFAIIINPVTASHQIHSASRFISHLWAGNAEP